MERSCNGQIYSFKFSAGDALPPMFGGVWSYQLTRGGALAEGPQIIFRDVEVAKVVEQIKMIPYLGKYGIGAMVI